ncbi:hypothetical protein GCM10027422_04770 [Hymenobacter arcticus]
MPAAPALTTPAAPTALLAGWEATATPAQLAAQTPHRPALFAWLTALRELVASAPPLPGNVDMGDVHTVMRGAGAIRAAQTETTGPGRAAAALWQLLATLPPAVEEQPAQYALLYIVSDSAAPLEMAELSELTETILSALLHNDGELIFGHDERVMVATGAMQVWLLLSY